ncbi:MAG: hypothetical protein ACT4OO_12165 [Nitrospiraceae bacterium]
MRVAQAIWRCMFLVVFLLTEGRGGERAFAIQAEDTSEKAANLDKQAKGGLFKLWTFDQQVVGDVPGGFSLLSLGQGPAAWKIQADTTAPSTPNAISASAPCAVPPCYHLLVAEGLQYEYPDLSVRFRAVSDGVSAQGGAVFGVKDAKNFYAAIVDLTAKSVEVVRIVDGSETLLSRAAVSLKTLPWHTLRVQRNTIISKDFIEVFVDGKLVSSVEDQSLGMGQIGLALRGQTVLHFDNLHAVPLYSHRPLSAPAAY